jgi:hypothetical protein
VHIYVTSEPHSYEGQRKFPVLPQYETFWIKNNIQRRVFAWRHFETGQYVAQSGLHLHQSEPHSCKENKTNSCQELRHVDGFT